jgi:hypothetical protein
MLPGHKLHRPDNIRSSNSHWTKVAAERGWLTDCADMAWHRRLMTIVRECPGWICTTGGRLGPCCEKRLRQSGVDDIAHRKGTIGGSVASLRRRSGEGTTMTLASRASPSHDDSLGPTHEDGGGVRKLGTSGRKRHTRLRRLSGRRRGW